MPALQLRQPRLRCAHLPGRDQPTARNQLVLNLALPRVRDYLFAALDAVLREVPISYLKWDHNRDLAPAGGRAQVLGSYDLLGRLRAAHPAVEIEGCAGGGGRSDAGMAPYVHRFWTSDNIDAVSRVPIQRGFLAFLPPELMGAHVGASPAHATGRSQSLGFRAAVATPGHFGVFMLGDALKLQPELDASARFGLVTLRRRTAPPGLAVVQDLMADLYRALVLDQAHRFEFGVEILASSAIQNGVGFLNFTVTVCWSTFATMTSW